MKRYAKTIEDAWHGVVYGIATISIMRKVDRFLRDYPRLTAKNGQPAQVSENSLWNYFQHHREGRGIWKWEHYFEAYHRHLQRFRGQKIKVLEVGVYGGGSLEMWRSYFGSGSHIYGVDIEGSSKAYATDCISILIGDQSDRAFWQKVKQTAGSMDVIIDDGGHTFEQQRTTLEEMLPSLNPGGVYICEDVHGTFNKFSRYASGLVDELNRTYFGRKEVLESAVSPFQSSIHSLHFYPYMVVIEKRQTPLSKFSAPKHGTQW